MRALELETVDSAEIKGKLFALDLELDPLSHKVTRAGKALTLQAREYKLLLFLMLNKGRVVTREMLLEHVWNYNFDPQTNLIDVHISRLRAKIDKPFERKVIETIRGYGYRVSDDD